MEKGFLELYLLQTRAFLSDWQSFLSHLPEAEQQQAQQMGAESRRRQFVIGRYFLRNLAKENYETALPAKLSATEAGKPLAAGLGLHFNLSHTEESLLIGFSDSELGVDIEALNRPLKVEVLARYEQDVGQIPKANYIEHWCLKESYAKATGKGLGPYLRGSHFDLTDKSFSVDNESEAYSFSLLKTDKECIAACVLGPVMQTQFLVWTESRFQEVPSAFDHLRNKGNK